MSVEAEARVILAEALATESTTLVDLLGRVLPFDLAAARVLATYRIPERAPLGDALIAAVAQAARMTVVTRNVRHVRPLRVACLDPWAGDVGG